MNSETIYIRSGTYRAKLIMSEIMSMSVTDYRAFLKIAAQDMFANYDELVKLREHFKGVNLACKHKVSALQLKLKTSRKGDGTITQLKEASREKANALKFTQILNEVLK